MCITLILKPDSVHIHGSVIVSRWFYVHPGTLQSLNSTVMFLYSYFNVVLWNNAKHDIFTCIVSKQMLRHTDIGIYWTLQVAYSYFYSTVLVEGVV